MLIVHRMETCLWMSGELNCMQTRLRAIIHPSSFGHTVHRHEGTFLLLDWLLQSGRQSEGVEWWTYLAVRLELQRFHSRVY